MPTTTTDDGIELYYETAGSGETVAFIGEAGLGGWQWGWQHGGVAGPYRSLVWDLRGTGRSEMPAGPYTVERLAQDLERVLADVAVRNAHLVGVGLGGMVALQYAREFTRAQTLTLFNSARSGTEIDCAALRELYEPKTRSETQESALVGWLSAPFREGNSDLIERIGSWRREGDADSDGFEAQLSAIEGFNAGPLYELTLPALVCHAVDDPVVSVEDGEALAQDLPRGTFEPVEGRHLCFIEHSRAVTDRLCTFFDDTTE
ncbi:alpha/beta fold hydrolase [Halovenus rubra]|uniref:Alpha/beta fold hydrolase n=2 Tax=Halovenus rubra TaxID=869890 RepID=A0ABD5X7U8_9EURY